MPRREDPDETKTMDVDGRGPALPTREPVWRRQEDMARRDDSRDYAKDTDRRIERTPGYSRAAKDKDRAQPRPTTAPLGHPRKARQLPGQDQARVPISSRQRKDRSATKNRVEDRMAGTVHQAVHEAISDKGTWDSMNRVLSAAAGNVQHDRIPEETRRRVQRVDRAIQAYERENDRSHVVYTQVQMPAYINASNAMGYVRRNLPEGSVIDLDRYTFATHCMHEFDAGLADRKQRERTVVFELATRRGMYMGSSDSRDDTRHLLPRSMRLRVLGHHEATYTRPDGSTGTRWVVQLQDEEPPHWKDSRRTT